MFPYVYILGYEIELYNIFNFLAVCAVVFLGVHWNYRYGPRYTIGLDILFLMAPLAFLLGRIFFYIFLACPGSKMQFFNMERGGSMFLGAFTGGLFGALLYFELKRIPLLQGLEIFLPYIPIGGIFGRLGCFCEGCCYGTMSNTLFALRFPKGSPAWVEQASKGLISADQFFSLPVHPTQLYEIGIWIIIALILIPLRHRNPRKGVITLVFLLLYFFNRLVQDFVRADYSKVYFGLDLMQLLALLIIPLSLLGLFFIYRDKWLVRLRLL